MKSDHWSTAELLERAKHLKELARKATAQPARRSKNIRTITRCLLIGEHSGGGELHQNFADIFFIIDGHATVVTGGSLVEAKTTGPGEMRGKSVEGGSRQELKAGDVVHIPAGMPHQTLVADGESVTYFVVKVEEAR